MNGQTPALQKPLLILSDLVIVVTTLWATALNLRAEAPLFWYSSIEEASARAVPDNRPLIIDFSADWCIPCKVMEKEVYSTPDFQETSKRFLLVKIDFDRKVAVARKYSVQTLPTIVFADSYGKELFRYDGYLDPKSLLQLAKALPADVTDFNRLNRVLAVGKDNVDALEQMGQRLRAAGAVPCE